MNEILEQLLLEEQQLQFSIFYLFPIKNFPRAYSLIYTNSLFP